MHQQFKLLSYPEFAAFIETPGLAKDHLGYFLDVYTIPPVCLAFSYLVKCQGFAKHFVNFSFSRTFFSFF